MILFELLLKRPMVPRGLDSDHASDRLVILQLDALPTYHLRSHKLWPRIGSDAAMTWAWPLALTLQCQTTSDRGTLGAHHPEIRPKGDENRRDLNRRSGPCASHIRHGQGGRLHQTRPTGRSALCTPLAPQAPRVIGHLSKSRARRSVLSGAVRTDGFRPRTGPVRG